MTQPLPHETFNDAFVNHLLDSIRKSGFACTYEDKKGSLILSNALQGCENSSVVILIDEYDAPLTAVLDDETEFNNRKEILDDFFLAIKGLNGYLRFIFLTGVVKFSNLSIFSSFNILQDISFNPQFGNIVGYTQEELETYCGEHLDNAACVLNEEENTDQYTKESIIAKLKQLYDGYSFDEEASCHVYNPWTILNFLEYPMDGFKAHWILSGGTYPELLRNYIEKVFREKLGLNLLNVDSSIACTTAPLAPSSLSTPSTTEDLLATLYQAGYFTIKEYISGAELVTGGIPNLEIKKAFAQTILAVMLKAQTAESFRSSYATATIDALYDCDFAKLKGHLEDCLNAIPYDSFKNFTESAFRDVIRLCFMLFGANIQTEVHSPLGRADLIITTDTTMYVIELKVATSEKEVSAKRDEALKQLIDRKYADRATSLDVIPLVMVILNEAKSEDNPAKFKVPVLEDIRQVK